MEEATGEKTQRNGKRKRRNEDGQREWTWSCTWKAHATEEQRVQNIWVTNHCTYDTYTLYGNGAHGEEERRGHAAGANKKKGNQALAGDRRGERESPWFVHYRRIMIDLLRRRDGCRALLICRVIGPGERALGHEVALLGAWGVEVCARG